MIRVIDAKPKLEAYFKDLFDKTDSRIRSAVRHGISEAVNTIVEKTKNNISSSWFNGTTSAGRTIRGNTYTTPLIEGVKGYLYKNEMSGVVDILGNTRTNDGTWRLRFFEMGTKLRKSKHGKNYGKIRETWFFDRAVSSTGSDAVDMIQRSISSAIEEINKKTPDL